MNSIVEKFKYFLTGKNNADGLTDSDIVRILADCSASERQKEVAEKALLNALVGYVSVGFKYLRIEEVIFNVFKDAFTDLCHNLRQNKYKSQAKLSTYFYRIFVNKCIDESKRQNKTETTKKKIVNPDFYKQFEQKYVLPYDKFFDALTAQFMKETEIWREEWTKTNVNDIKLWRIFKKQSPLYADHLCKKYFDNWSNNQFVEYKLYPNKNTTASSLSQALKSMLHLFNS